MCSDFLLRERGGSFQADGEDEESDGGDRHSERGVSPAIPPYHQTSSRILTISWSFPCNSSSFLEDWSGDEEEEEDEKDPDFSNQEEEGDTDDEDDDTVIRFLSTLYNKITFI